MTLKLSLIGEISIGIEPGCVLSPRIIELLKLVDRYKSLNTAVKEIGMSYSYAWNTLYKIQCRINNPVITKERGGRDGGYTQLTEWGKGLTELYDQVKKDVDGVLEKYNSSDCLRKFRNAG